MGFRGLSRLLDALKYFSVIAAIPVTVWLASAFGWPLWLSIIMALVPIPVTTYLVLSTSTVGVMIIVRLLRGLPRRTSAPDASTPLPQTVFDLADFISGLKPERLNTLGDLRSRMDRSTDEAGWSYDEGRQRIIRNMRDRLRQTGNWEAEFLRIQGAARVASAAVDRALSNIPEGTLSDEALGAIRNAAMDLAGDLACAPHLTPEHLELLCAPYEKGLPELSMFRAQAATAPIAGNHHSVSVLVVDDLIQSRDRVKRIFGSEAELEVVGEAGTGNEALEAAERLHPDVVLMNINMPEMDGLTATKILHQRAPEVAVVMMTLRNEDESIARAMRAGARGYLVKPFDPDDLIDAICDARGTDPPTIHRGGGLKDPFRQPS